MTAAVVLGGGFAGVLAASVLARHVGQVTVIESGSYPGAPGPRPGLPQAHHNHVLVAGGARALDTLLPGTTGALFARGAHRRDMPGGALILSAQGWFRRHETGAYLIACSRGLTDHVVRERALADGLAAGTVSVRERTRAVGLAGDATRVTGVTVRGDDGQTATLRADIVIDATGRGSQAPRWLAALGVPPAEEVSVDSGLVYATRVFQAPASLGAAIPAIMIHPRPAAPGAPEQGATLFPIEDGRWIVTLTGTRGGEPPRHEQGFTDFARALRTPLVADLMAAATPVGGVRGCHGTANWRRFFERVRLPAGFLVLGDALMALNPVYSHGLSVAALSVLRLAEELERHGTAPSRFPALAAAVAREADVPWHLATQQDARPAPGRPRIPPVPRRPGAAAGPRTAMSRAVLSRPELMTSLFRTQALLPADSLPPSVLLRALSADPVTPLSAAEAVAQYPRLAQWWQDARPAITSRPLTA